MAKILTQRRRVAEVVSTTSGPILTQRRRDAETGRARAPREPWPRVKLGDVCEVVLGGTPKTAIGEYWGGDILWLTPGEMGKISGPYVNNTNRKLTRAGLANGSSLFPARSVILSTRAPIGYVFINTVAMCTNQGCKTLVPDERIWPEFLYYNLIGRTDELNDLGSGTTFKELATGVLKNIEIPLPPLSVQRDIVARLGCELGAVEKVTKAFEELERAAEGEFKAELKETFEEISRGGAETRRLGDVCEFRRGLTYSKNDEVSYSSNAILRSNNVDLSTGKLDLTELKYVADTFDVPKMKRVQLGSILMCMANGSKAHLGKVALVDTELTYAFGGFMGLLVPKNTTALSEYIYWVLSSYDFKRMLINLTDGANINNLKFADISEYEFPLPLLSTQRKIVASLDAARLRKERLVAAAKRGREVAALWRKAILKEAFE